MDTPEYGRIRDQKHRIESKERLSKILKKKIQTTMIGALSTIEENLSFLWEQDNPKFTKQEMKEVYEKIRSEILDRGNNQARNVDAELSNYDIAWLRYSIKIPFIQRPNN
jgi:hypothetical protein